MANMQACPCCRRQDYTLVDIIITLNQEQKDAHYKSLIEAYNEDHQYVPPVREVRRHIVQRPADIRREMEINFDAAVLEGNFHIALHNRRALEGRNWELNEVRLHNFEALRLQEVARQEAEARAFNARRDADDARREAQRIARRDARRVERQEQRQIERDAAEAQRAADREAAAEQGVQPNNDGDIVLRDPADLAGLNQRFNARTPAPARARVVLGAVFKIGDLPFNARPMLQCVGCNKKTRRVCHDCNDAYCCAHCNACGNGDCFVREGNAHLPHNYQRL